MRNLILDEKKMLRVGDVCAIALKNIKPVGLSLDDFDLEDISVKFFPKKQSISVNNEITFMKYLGKGMFMDLVSDQLIISELYSEDDIGSDEHSLLDVESQAELSEIKEQWNMICSPNNVEAFKQSFSIFMENPLVIDVSDAPFMALDSAAAIKFSSQSLEKIKSKFVSAKITAQQEMQQDYNELENSIVEFYTNGTITTKKQM